MKALDPPQRISPTTVRYIKLGPANGWFKSAIANNRIEFGHREVPHELALAGDAEAISALHLAKGRTAGKANDYAREVLDFYRLGADCLWITFGEGALWWGFASPEVHLLPGLENGPSRYRELLAPWSSLDLAGRRLSVSTLSTRLTQVAAYRQTLCRLRDPAAMVRRINGIEEPVIVEARLAQEALIDIATRLIGALHWRDFEILCDLIFARSGWQRVAELGGLQKDTDLVLSQTSTGERAYVQVKSSADQTELDRYVESFTADPTFDRMFFVCHSPKGALAAIPAKPLHIWTGTTIARQTIAAGLFDWLTQKAS